MELLIQNHSLAFELARRLHEWGTLMLLYQRRRDPERTGAIRRDLRRSRAIRGDPERYPRSAAIRSDPRRSSCDPGRSPALGRGPGGPERGGAGLSAGHYGLREIEVSDRLPPARETLSR
jgi:hypothetical protein